MSSHTLLQVVYCLSGRMFFNLPEHKAGYRHVFEILVQIREQSGSWLDILLILFFGIFNENKSICKANSKCLLFHLIGFSFLTVSDPRGSKGEGGFCGDFIFNMTFCLTIVKMKSSNHHVLYHSPWQPHPSGKAPVPCGSESPHVLPSAIILNPELCDWAPYMMHGKRWLSLKGSCLSCSGKKYKGKGLTKPRTDLCTKVT